MTISISYCQDYIKDKCYQYILYFQQHIFNRDSVGMNFEEKKIGVRTYTFSTTQIYILLGSTQFILVLTL